MAYFILLFFHFFFTRSPVHSFAGFVLNFIRILFRSVYCAIVGAVACSAVVSVHIETVIVYACLAIFILSCRPKKSYSKNADVLNRIYSDSFTCFASIPIPIYARWSMTTHEKNKHVKITICCTLGCIFLGSLFFCVKVFAEQKLIGIFMEFAF